jgi:hypothetical protein
MLMPDLGLGVCIRKNLGLWQGNAALLEAPNETHPDDNSVAILRAFRLKLCAGLPNVH